MRTKRWGTTSQLWRCPSCGYDFIPDEHFEEFYCLECGEMGGESNKCKSIQQCDDCGEDQEDCSCCQVCNELECEGCEAALETCPTSRDTP